MGRRKGGGGAFFFFPAGDTPKLGRLGTHHQKWGGVDRRLAGIRRWGYAGESTEDLGRRCLDLKKIVGGTERSASDRKKRQNVLKKVGWVFAE